LYSFLANADVYFDETLFRLTATRPNLNNKVLALLKWSSRFHAQSRTINLRIDSQDSWVFRPPVYDEVLQLSDFRLGVPKCDNRVAAIFQQANYTVVNAAFAVRAIELQTEERKENLYGTKDTVVGRGTNLLISDVFTLG
jgi:hypothetical protein